MTDLATGATVLPPELTPPISMRWPPGLLERADAIAAMAGPGITRSVVLRMACEAGIAHVANVFGHLGAGSGR